MEKAVKTKAHLFEIPIKLDSFVERNGRIIKALKIDHFLDYLKREGLSEQAKAFEEVQKMAFEVKKAGGRAYILGGTTRALMFSRITNDVDVQVYGLSSEKTLQIVEAQSYVKHGSIQYGAFSINRKSGIHIDVQLPKKPKKNQPGFEVDPDMSLEESLSQMDFSMNTILLDPITGEVLDMLNGQKDILNKKLVIVSKTDFSKAPNKLSILFRAARFSIRYGLSIDDEDMSIITLNSKKIHKLPKKYVEREWKKILSEEKIEDIMIQLREFGILDSLHPQLIALMDSLYWKECIELLTCTSINYQIKGNKQLSFYESLALITRYMNKIKIKLGEEFLKTLGFGERRVKEIKRMVVNC